jgi:Protein of unknown function (DUF3112)
MSATTPSPEAMPIPEESPPPPQIAYPGGVPTVAVDVPICTIFLILYLIGAIWHVTLFRRNRKAKQRFRLSMLLIYFCVIRIATLTLRMVWSTYLSNIRVAITSQIFITTGVLLIIIFDLVLVLRLLRATHPRTAYQHLPVGILVVLIVCTVVTCLVQNFYAQDNYSMPADRAVTLFAGTLFLIVAAFPVLFVLLNYLTLRRSASYLRRRGYPLGDDEGHSVPLTVPTGRKNRIMAGSVTEGSTVLVVASLILMVGVIFRAVANFAAARSSDDPAWYHHKASFYIFNFVTELVVIYFYAAMRVDRIFYVPDMAMEAVSRRYPRRLSLNLQPLSARGYMSLDSYPRRESIRATRPEAEHGNIPTQGYAPDRPSWTEWPSSSLLQAPQPAVTHGHIPLQMIYRSDT